MLQNEVFFVPLRCKKCGISQKKYSNMIIERKKYLDMLIESQGNGLVKIITGAKKLQLTIVG